MTAMEPELWTLDTTTWAQANAVPVTVLDISRSELIEWAREVVAANAVTVPLYSGDKLYDIIVTGRDDIAGQLEVYRLLDSTLLHMQLAPRAVCRWVAVPEGAIVGGNQLMVSAENCAQLMLFIHRNNILHSIQWDRIGDRIMTIQLGPTINGTM